jgi:hypothetical protein
MLQIFVRYSTSEKYQFQSPCRTGEKQEGKGMDKRKWRTLCVFFCTVMLATVFGASTANAENLETTDSGYYFWTYDEDLQGFNAAISGLQSTYLNFDELNDRAKVTDIYADEGVYFSSLVVCCGWSGVSRYYPTARYGNGSLSGSNPVSYPIGVGVPWDNRTNSELRVAFSSGVSFIGAHFIDNGAPIIARAYDINDNLIGDFYISRGGESRNSGEWWGVVTDGRVISKMTFTAVSRGDFFAIDNFIFQSTVIEATVDIDPDTLNLNARGVFTAYISSLDDYSVEDIDVATIECEGAPAIRASIEEGILIVKFNREDLVGVETDNGVELTVTGWLTDGTPFEGSDTIRVISKGGGKK